MFDTTKRRVNLGKKKKALDSKELLRHARENRKRLQANRKRREAAESVQKWYRGLLTRRNLEPDLRKMFDTEYKQLLSTLKQNPSDPKNLPSRHSLALLIRIISQLCALGTDQDKSRIQNVLILLNKSLGQKDPARNYLAHLLDGNVLMFKAQMERFCSVLLHALTKCGPKDTKLAQLASAFLLTIFAIQRWNIEVDKSFAQAVVSTIFRQMVGRGLYTHLRKIFLTVSPQGEFKGVSQQALSVLTLFVFRNTHHAVNSETCPQDERIPMIQSFLREILTIPLLWHRLDALKKPPLVKEAAQCLGPVASLAGTKSDPKLRELSPSYSAFDLQIVPAVQISAPNSSKMDESYSSDEEDEDSGDEEKKEDAPWMKVHKPSLPRGAWLCGNLLQATTFKSPEPAFYALIGHHLSLLEKESLPEFSIVHPKYSEQISVLTSTQFHVRLKELKFDEENIGSVAHLIRMTIKIYPKVQTSLLQSLAWKTGLVQKLWTVFSPQFALLLKEEALKSKKRNVATLLPGGEFSAPFEIFCRVCNYLLRTVSDTDLLEKGKIIPKKDLVTLVRVLRQLLIRLCTGEKEIADAACRSLRNSAGAIFSQLRERQSRNHFVEPKEWLFPGFSGSDMLTRELLAENGKGRWIMRNIPFVVPFETRVKVFYEYIKRDKEFQASVGRAEFGRGRGLKAKIRRTHLFEDGYKTFMDMENPKGRVQITFINDQGIPEAGIDGGGLFKEFMISLSEEVFAPNYGLFLANWNHELYPSPHSGRSHENHLHLMRFLGLLLGKALYDGVLVELRFANFFLRKVLEKRNFLEDLRSLDRDVFRNVRKVMEMSSGVDALGLTYSVTDVVFGKPEETDLISNGGSIEVTDENKLDYLQRLTYFKLNTQVKHQSAAFLSGLGTIIESHWLKMFSADELQTLISGTPKIDMADLQSNTAYQGGFHPSQKIIKWFWEVIHALSQEEKAKFLMFATSCSRAPLLGFKALDPPFGIMLLRNASYEALPLAATCMNLLKMPQYPSKALLEHKLKTAINSGAGFDFS